jgi:alkylation response protein AidB-like acyl-CoA dehydrogenase
MYLLQEFLAEIVKVAKRVTRRDATAWDDAALRREVGHLQAELDALWAMVKLSVSEAKETGIPGIGSAAVKLVYTELSQRAGDVAMRVLGRAGLSREDVADLPSERFLAKMLMSLNLTIAAGTSQIQRNIISQRILGLPRDR